MRRNTLLIAAALAVLFHAIFCWQAVITAKNGGMMANEAFMVIYYPHAILMYFLPPAYPISYPPGGGVAVDWLRFAGKLAVAFPASVMYGLAVAGVWKLVVQKKKIEERA